MADKDQKADTLTELLRRETESLRSSVEWHRDTAELVDPPPAGLDSGAEAAPSVIAMPPPSEDAAEDFTIIDAEPVDRPEREAEGAAPPPVIAMPPPAAEPAPEAEETTATAGAVADPAEEDTFDFIAAIADAVRGHSDAAAENAASAGTEAAGDEASAVPIALSSVLAMPASTEGTPAMRSGVFPPLPPKIRIRQSLAERERSADEGEPAEQPVAEDIAIDISRLGLTYAASDGPVEALSGIDLRIKRGEFISLIGPSGCGKTTLLRVIADLERATSGTITVNGVSPEQARRERAYGYVFQAPALYPWRTIARNVALPLEVMGLPAAERRRRIQTNLELVNLGGFEKKYPWQLSGGMQQRASIARALAVEPDLLLMDEPFGALDEIVRDHLNEQLLNLWAKTDKTVVFVTHSIPEAVFLSTRIVVMTPRPGKIYDVIESTLPRDRNLDIREAPEFLRIAHRVRQGLRAGHSYED